MVVRQQFSDEVEMVLPFLGPEYCNKIGVAMHDDVQPTHNRCFAKGVVASVSKVVVATG